VTKILGAVVACGLAVAMRTPVAAKSTVRYTSTSTPHSQAFPGVKRDADGRIECSSSARTSFQHSHPCPLTGKARGACPGYVVDHVVPLKRGGRDEPSHMQWQTTQATKEKDKVSGRCAVVRPSRIARIFGTPLHSTSVTPAPSARNVLRVLVQLPGPPAARSGDARSTIHLWSRRHAEPNLRKVSAAAAFVPATSVDKFGSDWVTQRLAALMAAGHCVPASRGRIHRFTSLNASVHVPRICNG